jgi:DNA-binding NarL/FixJ family response regulator
LSDEQVLEEFEAVAYEAVVLVLAQSHLVADLRRLRSAPVVALQGHAPEATWLVAGFDGCVPDVGSTELRDLVAERDRLRSASEPQALVVDDNELVRLAAETCLQRKFPACSVDGGLAALRMLREVPLSVVVLDVGMPGLSGVETLTAVKSWDPSVGVLILTGNSTEQVAIDALRSGADGYLKKPLQAAELTQAVADERTKVMRRRLVHPPPATRVPELSERQLQVVRWVVEGHTNKVIAERLSVSIKTVEGYRERAMRKVGAASRADLVRFAMQAGLLTP